MKKYSNTIIDSTLIYLEELQYRANNDKSWVDALYSLQIINSILDWSYMFDFVTEQDRQGLMLLMDHIIANQKNIDLPYINTDTEIGYNNEYTNVNAPQSYMTWGGTFETYDSNKEL